MSGTMTLNLRDLLHLARLMRQMEDVAEDHALSSNEIRVRVSRIAADICDFITRHSFNLSAEDQTEFERLVWLFPLDQAGPQ